MRFPNKAEVEAVRKMYPVGTEIELIYMEDTQAPPPGTKGVVSHVDDIGQVHVTWESGSTLTLIPGIDCCIRVDVDSDMER